MSLPMESDPKRFEKKVFFWVILWAALLGVVLFAALIFVFVLILQKEAIHDAARRGDVTEIVELLDRSPQIIEQRDRLQLTPLHVASWDGQAEVLELLVSRGADVNAKWELARTGDGNWNALHIAAIQGRVEAARVLIRAGTEINGLTLKGETPIDVAVRNRHNRFVEFLRANGGTSGHNR